MRAVVLFVAAVWALSPFDVHASATNLCNNFSFDVRAAYATDDAWVNEPSDVYGHHISWFTVPANGCVLLSNPGAVNMFFASTHDGEYEWGNPFDYPADQYFNLSLGRPPAVPMCVFLNKYQECIETSNRS